MVRERVTQNHESESGWVNKKAIDDALYESALAVKVRQINVRGKKRKKIGFSSYTIDHYTKFTVQEFRKSIPKGSEQLYFKKTPREFLYSKQAQQIIVNRFIARLQERATPIITIEDARAWYDAALAELGIAD